MLKFRIPIACSVAHVTNCTGSVWSVNTLLNLPGVIGTFSVPVPDTSISLELFQYRYPKLR